MKKVIALAMAAAMVSSVGASAFAATELSDSGKKITVTTARVTLKDNGTQGTQASGINDFRPDKTAYIDLEGLISIGGRTVSGEDLVDSDYFSFKTKKDDGSKYIKSITRKQETNSKVHGSGTGRSGVIEMKLKDFYDDDDHKIDVTFTFTVKSKYITEQTANSDALKKYIGAKVEIPVKFFVNNETKSGDTDPEFNAGDGGIVVKPVANDDNEITWSDENRDLAKLKFEADSDVNKFFPKLSTKWSNETYAAMFADQDAFFFDFVSNPTISATARPELTIYNPFVNDDDELTVDPEDVVIYQIANNATLAASSEEVELATAILDGRLIDVTDKFTAGENDDGDYVFVTKTRTLGSYIICEKAPSEEAFDEAAGETPETNVPAETVKPNPGTGR